jgi:hypothetical protein
LTGDLEKRLTRAQWRSPIRNAPTRVQIMSHAGTRKRTIGYKPLQKHNFHRKFPIREGDCVDAIGGIRRFRTDMRQVDADISNA